MTQIIESRDVYTTTTIAVMPILRTSRSQNPAGALILGNLLSALWRGIRRLGDRGVLAINTASDATSVVLVTARRFWCPRPDDIGLSAYQASRPLARLRLVPVKLR